MSPMNALIDEGLTLGSIVVARLLVLVGAGILLRLLYLEWTKRRKS